MEVYLKWDKNSICGPADDPHKGTMQEGFYAGISVEYEGKEYTFRLSAHEYNYDLVEKLTTIIEKGETC